MGIGSLGSVSFWQQDQNYWNQAQQQAQSAAASTALITTMGNLQTNKVRGLASLANELALSRVNAQLQAALQSAQQTSQSGSSTSGSQTSSAGSPATGTGTAPLTAGTSLLTLGIPPTGTVTVSDGTNTTTYSSTGTDTVGDLVNALNQKNVYGNAQVAAWLNSSGQLVISGLNVTDPVSVGGTFASNVGFGAKNSSFSAHRPNSRRFHCVRLFNFFQRCGIHDGRHQHVNRLHRYKHHLPATAAVQFVLCGPHQRDCTHPPGERLFTKPVGLISVAACGGGGRQRPPSPSGQGYPALGDSNHLLTLPNLRSVSPILAT